MIMLLGNKCDMASERVVRTEDGERLAKVRTLSWVGGLLTQYNYVFTCSLVTPNLGPA